MDETTYFREDQGERIKDSLPGKAGDVGRSHRYALALVAPRVEPVQPPA